MARRRQLLEMLVAERDRRQAAADPALHGRIDAHLRWLEEALAEIERALAGARSRAIFADDGPAAMTDTRRRRRAGGRAPRRR